MRSLFARDAWGRARGDPVDLLARRERRTLGRTRACSHRRAVGDPYPNCRWLSSAASADGYTPASRSGAFIAADLRARAAGAHRPHAARGLLVCHTTKCLCAGGLACRMPTGQERKRLSGSAAPGGSRARVRLHARRDTGDGGRPASGASVAKRSTLHGVPTQFYCDVAIRENDRAKRSPSVSVCTWRRRTARVPCAGTMTWKDRRMQRVQGIRSTR